MSKHTTGALIGSIRKEQAMCIMDGVVVVACYGILCLIGWVIEGLRGE